MILDRSMVPPIALLVAVATTTLTMYAGLGVVPAAFVGGGDVVAITPSQGTLFGRATLPDDVARAAATLPGVTVVSPEVYAFTAFGGQSLAVRGVDFEPFMELEAGRLAAGALPKAGDEVLAGAGLARAHGLAAGDRIVVAGSLQRLAVPLHVVGVVELASAADAELLVPLGVARSLAALPQGLHAVRVATSEPLQTRAVTQVQGANVVVGTVEASKGAVVPGEPAFVRATVTNWGHEPGVHEVTLRKDGEPVASRVLGFAPRETRVVDLPFSVNRTGSVALQVNPVVAVEAVEPTLRFVGAPLVAGADASYRFTVTDTSGAPVAGVNVSWGDGFAFTDARGEVNVTAPSTSGAHAIVATTPAGVGAAWPTEVGVAQRDATPREPQFVPVIVDVGTRGTVGVHEAPVFVVRAANRGAAAGVVDIAIEIDDTGLPPQRLALGPFEDGSLAFVGPRLQPGAHRVEVLRSAVFADFQVYAGRNPEGEEALQALAPRLIGGEDVDRFARRDFDTLRGLVAGVLGAVSVTSVGLALAGAGAVVARHLGERVRAIGTLKAVGATDDDVVGFVAADASRFAVVAGFLGVPVGAAIAWLLGALQIVHAFGHAVRPVLDWRLLALVFLVTWAFTTLFARALTRVLLWQRIDDLQGGRLARYEWPAFVRRLTNRG